MIRDITFADAIRSAARDAGRSLTAEQIDGLNSIVQSIATIGDDRTLSLEVDGRTLSFAEFLAREFPKFPRAPALGIAANAPPTDPAGNPISSDGQHILIRSGSGERWARRSDPLTQIAIGWEEQRRAALTREAASWTGNPWAPDTFNRSRQVVLEKTHPERAAQLKASAGKY